MTQPSTSHGRIVARVVGGIAAGAMDTSLVVCGAAPAGAQPAPKPAPRSASSHSVTTEGGLSLHLDLPGLLRVHVDLPPLNGLLGSRPATDAGVGRTPAVVSPSSGPVVAPRPTAAPTAVPAPTRTAQVAPRPVPRPSTVTRPRPQRSDAAVGGADTGRTVRDTVRDTVPVRPVQKKKLAERDVRKRAAEAFSRPLAPVAPVWLLVVVVGLCALGTLVVVRLAGRKDRAVT